jgi:hypothetical protein
MGQGKKGHALDDTLLFCFRMHPLMIVVRNPKELKNFYVGEAELRVVAVKQNHVLRPPILTLPARCGELLLICGYRDPNGTEDLPDVGHLKSPEEGRRPRAEELSVIFSRTDGGIVVLLTRLVPEIRNRMIVDWGVVG